VNSKKAGAHAGAANKMENSIEKMRVEFHNGASQVFFSVYHAFEQAVVNVSRRNEEFRFQQLKKQYAATLEKELEHLAKEILDKYRNERQVNEIDQMFHQFAKDYLHSFVQKINDL
jgi:glutamyl-tRNA reductase